MLQPQEAQNTRLHLSNVQVDGMYQGFNVNWANLTTFMIAPLITAEEAGLWLTEIISSFLGCFLSLSLGMALISTGP